MRYCNEIHTIRIQFTAYYGNYHPRDGIRTDPGLDTIDRSLSKYNITINHYLIHMTKTSLFLQQPAFSADMLSQQVK